MKYPLDHGVDLMKVDVKGHTVLHNVVCAGMSHQGFWSCLCGCVPVCLYFYVHHRWFCKMVQKLVASENSWVLLHAAIYLILSIV